MRFFPAPKTEINKTKRTSSKPLITQIETISLDWNKPQSRCLASSGDVKPQTFQLLRVKSQQHTFFVCKWFEFCLHIAVEFFSPDGPYYNYVVLLVSLDFRSRNTFETKFWWPDLWCSIKTTLTHFFGHLVLIQFMNIWDSFQERFGFDRFSLSKSERIWMRLTQISLIEWHERIDEKSLFELTHYIE